MQSFKIRLWHVASASGQLELLTNFLLRSIHLHRLNHPPHKALLLQVTLTYCQVCQQPLSDREALWDRRLNDLATEFYEKFGLARISHKLPTVVVQPPTP